MHIIMYERSMIMCILATSRSRIVGRFRVAGIQLRAVSEEKTPGQHLRASAMKSFWRACACAVY